MSYELARGRVPPREVKRFRTVPHVASSTQQGCLPDTGTCSCQLYCIGSYSGWGIGCAMMLGNFIAMRFIRNVKKKLYQKVIAGIMIAVSLRLVVSQII